MGVQTLVLWDVDHTLMETRGMGFELFRAAFEQASGEQLVHAAEVTGRTEPAIFRETLESHHIPYSAALFDRYADLLAEGYRARAAELAPARACASRGSRSHRGAGRDRDSGSISADWQPAPGGRDKIAGFRPGRRA